MDKATNDIVSFVNRTTTNNTKDRSGNSAYTNVYYDKNKILTNHKFFRTPMNDISDSKSGHLPCLFSHACTINIQYICSTKKLTHTEQQGI